MSDPDFAERLELELKRRYDVCDDWAATPSNVLWAVLNAVAEARHPKKPVQSATGDPLVP